MQQRSTETKMTTEDWVMSWNKRVWFVVCAVAIASIWMPTVTVAQECEDFSGSSLIRRMGGRNAFHRGGVDNPEELAAVLAERSAELEEIMAERGLSHLTADLMAAIAAGEVHQGQVASGDVLDWMVYQGRQRAISGGPLCYQGKEIYDAYIVVVDEVVETPPAEAVCELAVDGNCETLILSVDASGSSDLAVVAMDGSELFTGATAWEGDYEDATMIDRTFSVTAENVGTRTITQHTFIIPKVCANLAYVGASEPRTEPGETDSCEKTVDLERCPYCEITAPAEVWTREEFEVSIDGYKNLSITDVSHETSGSVVATSPMKVKTPGMYLAAGEATNDSGKSATCEASFEAKARWTFRPYLASISPQANRESFDLSTPGNVNRVSLDTSSGVGVGAGLEYHVNDRVGIAGNAIVGAIDAEIMLDTNTVWALDDDSLSVLALTLGPTFHLTPEAKVDWFVEPFVGVFNLHDGFFSDQDLSGTIEGGNEFGVGLFTGFDIPFANSPQWGFHVGVRWMQAEFEDDDIELGVDPLILGVGLKYDF